MVLFTICINPLLCMLDTMLHENNNTAGRGTPNVVAYADDVRSFYTLQTTSQKSEMPYVAMKPPPEHD